jgi:RNA polymerase sigma-70 factor (ECF subfamily)
MLFGSHKKEKEAFQEAVLEHLDALYGTALRMTGQAAEAEDLVQDTVLRSIRFWDRFDPGTNLKAWLFKMMVNLFINKYRRSKRIREIQDGSERDDLIDRLMPEQQLASSHSPEEYFFERMFSDDVVRALDGLPHDFKMVVLMADVNGFSYSQIAEILGIPVGTVMSRLHRGRRLLRTALYQYAVAEGYVRAPADGESAPVDLKEFRARRPGGA